MQKWQEIADLIANIVNVPAALIMKTENEFMEVFTSSETENNPYKAGDKEHWHGLYCETVIKTQKKLHVPNALKDKNWDQNPDIKLGMIAYLGYPINFPDKKPFGTLCVLDNKERQFSAENEKLLLQFKKVIELDLALIFSLELTEKHSQADIIHRLSHEKEEYRATNEELKQVEQVLRKSEDRLSKIMIAANDGMYDWDLKTNKVYFDPRYYQMSGYDVDEFPHNLEEFQKRVHPDDVDYVMNEAEKHLKGETNRFSVKFRFRKKSGDWQWIQGKGIIVERNEEGEPQRFVGTHRDINEIKQVEEALKESEAYLKAVLESTADGILAIGKDRSVLYANDRFAKIWQIPEDVLENKDDSVLLQYVLDQLIEPDDFIKKVEELYNSDEESFDTIEFKDGRVIELLSLPLLKGTEVMGRVWSFRDITERKKSEEELRINEKSIESSQSAIVLANLDGELTYVNDAFLKMWGYSNKREVLGKQSVSFWTSETKAQDVADNSLQKGKWVGELTAKRKDGSTFTALVSTNLVLDVEGKPLLKMASFVDITDRKRAEEKFKNIFETANVGKSITLPDGRVNVNKAFAEMLGYTKEELENIEWQKLTHPEDLELSQEKIKPLLDGKKDSVRFEKRYIHKNGKPVWTDISTKLEHDEEGQPLYFITTVINISKQKKAEEKLKSNYELLQIAGETAKFGGWSVDLEKNSCTWSDVVADIHEMPHGYAPPVEEGINFYAPEWREKITQVFTDCAQKGIPYDEEMEIITSKGKRVWVRTNGRAVKDENGRIIKVQGSFQDITERKQIEEALRQSEAFTRTILDNLPIGIAVNSVDPEVRFSYMNDKFPEIYRTTRKKLEEPDSFWKTVYEDPQFRKKLRRRVLDDCASGDPKQMRWTNIPVTRQGEETSYITAQNIPVPNQPLMISTVMDITEEKKAQEALQRIEWMLSKKAATVKNEQAPFYGDLTELNTSRLILDAVGKDVLKDIADDFLRLLESSAAIYEKNGDYALGIFASGWCRFMDQASRELCNTDDNKEALNCGKWLCHDSCWKEASLPAMESGQPVDIECQGGIHLYALPIIAGDEVIGAINFGYGDPPQDKEKLSELAEKYKVPLDELEKKAKEYESRPSFIIETAKDRLQASANLIGEIVSRKIAEREILKLNEELEQRVIERTAQLEASNKELEAFSYSVSHDLRAPLRHINGYVDLLYKKFRPDLPEKAQYYLNNVTDAATQMGTLIDELLQFSRTGRQEVRKTKIEMNVLVKEVVESIKQDIEKREIHWKVQELPQVFGDYSLLKQVWANLLDNAVKYTRDTRKAEISISCKEEEKNFVFSVRDNGVGFNMKYVHKLFGVFQRLHPRTKFEGTGIGLANVQRIIHKHNGQVWAEAEPGKGATFFFSLSNVDKTQANNK